MQKAVSPIPATGAESISPAGSDESSHLGNPVAPQNGARPSPIGPVGTRADECYVEGIVDAPAGGGPAKVPSREQATAGAVSPEQPKQSVDLSTVPVDLFDRLLFIPFFLCFLFSLLFFDPLQRLALRFGRDASAPGEGLSLHDRVVYWLNAALRYCLVLIGCRVEVRRGENLRGGAPAIEQWGPGPYIIVSNHQSLFDIPVLFWVLRRFFPRFVAKKELGKWIPSVSFNLRSGGQGLIDRLNPRQALPEIKRLGSLAAAKRQSVAIFPEGTRARAGTLKSFNHAGISALMQTMPSAKIVLVTVDNSWKLAARPLGPIPRGVPFQVLVHEPEELGGRSAKELARELERRSAEALARLRAERASRPS